MKVSKMFLVSTLFFALTSTCFAQEKFALVQELMVKSGAEKQLEGISQSVLLGIPDQHPQIPQEALQQVRQSFLKAYDVNQMRASVTQILDQTLTEADIQAALEWLNSPLGQKITQLEENASTPTASQDMANFMRDSYAKISEERRAQIERLDQAVHGTEMAVEAAMSTMIGTATAFHAVVNDPNKPSLEEILKRGEETRTQIVPQMKQTTQAVFLYTYQSLTDEELESYIQFFETDSGKKYATTMIQALMAAFKQSSQTLSEEVAKIKNEIKPAEPAAPVSGQ